MESADVTLNMACGVTLLCATMRGLRPAKHAHLVARVLVHGAAVANLESERWTTIVCRRA